MLDHNQLISGLSILLSFFVGYKYGLQKNQSKDEATESETPSTSKTFSDFGSDYKMVLVVRNDLKMGKGKIGAQCGHASVGAFEQALKKIPQVVRKWNSSGSMKVALKVESEAELMDIRKQALLKQFNCCLIRDAGRTQIEPNTKTVLAIGPAPSREIDRITGHLKLL